MPEAVRLPARHHDLVHVNAPSHLGVEHLGASVLGLGERRPRLSWRLPTGSTRQEAHAIEIDGRDLGRSESEDCVLVPWPGDPLASRQRVVWRVKVWTDGGESEWSRPAWFETGLLEQSDWVARWIEPYEAERSAHMLRHTFRLAAPAAQARIYATAHGIYETFLNGERVGDVELAPGFTSYPTTLHVQVYDVGDLLVSGENEWEVVLSDGWWRGHTGFFQLADGYGGALAFLGQLHADDVVITSGPQWWSATGPLLTADLMAGQSEDHRARPTAWQPVSVADHGLGRLSYSPAPPTRRVQELRPVAVTRPHPDRQVVDLGQNINGWLRLSDLGPAGTELTIVHGEFLNEAGDVTQDHLSPDFLGEKKHVGMIDRVVAAGSPGEVFEPRHTTHGFQFARIEGHPGRLTPDDVTGVVVHTDLRRTGWFRCSDERLNRLHDITEWSFRDNACEIPTDCPQRERAGWTGDWQLFIPTGAFLYDVAGFSLKWLRDLMAEQLDDGRITNYVPDALRQRMPSSEHWLFRQGSSGWGDAVVMVPWEMWRAYGDRDVLAELWPSMVMWVDFAATAARTLRYRGRAEARPRPAPHEEFLWDGGYHWGEWLEPGAQSDDHMQIDQGSVATAFLQHSAALAARIGRLLGHDTEAGRFEDLAANVLEAWRTEFIGPDGALTPDTQANHVRALAFRLVPDELRSPHGGAAGRTDTRGRDAPRHRLPGHAVPVARPGRHRPSRRGLRAAPAGHAAFVARHGRARGDDGVGAVGGHRHGRRAARVAEPLQQGRRHLVPAQLRRRHHPPRRAPRLPALPGRAPTRWRAHMGRGRARLALRAHRVRLAPRRILPPPDGHRAAGHRGRRRSPRRHPA